MGLCTSKMSKSSDPSEDVILTTTSENVNHSTRGENSCTVQGFPILENLPLCPDDDIHYQYIWMPYYILTRDIIAKQEQEGFIMRGPIKDNQWVRWFCKPK